MKKTYNKAQIIDQYQSKLKNRDLGVIEVCTIWSNRFISIRDYTYNAYINSDKDMAIIAVPIEDYKNRQYDISKSKLLIIPPNQKFDKKKFDNGDIKYSIRIERYIDLKSSEASGGFEQLELFNEEDSILKSELDYNKSYSKFTKREIACILLRTPNSGKEWLDKLITHKLKS